MAASSDLRPWVRVEPKGWTFPEDFFFPFSLKQIPGGKAPYSEPRYGHHESDAWSCPLPLKLTQVSRASCLQNSSMTHGQQ